ncbi:hypothetical protein [Dyadobacter sp. CY356]|uniref:hypothetical protein n=1 Tax=Dyadobacter sp. CY356 TaxID=2906442 RepID=UPI001F390914|nr:hypothetical protein [Dyadobacter sp. CY356]MCF0055053.1 hypothetical protein [Dyadobacter sp. CY356]
MMNVLLKIKSAFFLILVLFVLTNCKSEDPVEEPEKDVVCGVSDPVNNLRWLNKLYKEFYGGPLINGIVLYQYNDSQVIEVQSGVSSSTNIHQYFCDGVKLDLLDPVKFKEFRDNRIEIKVLYGTKLW